VAVSLIGYVRGTAVSLETEAEAEQETGLTGDEYLAEQDSEMAEILVSGEFPTLAGLLAPPAALDMDLDSLFEFGLQRLLDGIAALVQASEGGGS
jgi:hypothetical protein